MTATELLSSEPDREVTETAGRAARRTQEMRTMHKIKRRHLWAPAALVAAGPLALSACGKGSGSTASDGPAEGTSSYDLDDVYDINEQPRENLQAGGQLTLPVGGMGPNWNVAAVDGYYGSTLDILETLQNISTWTYDPLGQPILNEDYFLSAEEEITDDGTQLLHFTLNPEARWNDGTPIDFYTYEHTGKKNQHQDST